MGIELAASLIAAKSAATQQTIAIAVVKKAHQMEMALLEQLDAVARSAPPQGQGRVVDKLA